MRLYDNLKDALSEVKRDVYKAPRITSTRVQQMVDRDMQVAERQNIQFGIREMPDSVDELVKIAQESGNEFFQKYEDEIREWIRAEYRMRTIPHLYISHLQEPNERLHPALKKTLEGSYVSYSYPERLFGMESAMIGAFEADPFTRRAYWPIFNQQDALKAGKPTRVPCSLGYGFQLREIPGGNTVMHMTYHMRSSDFDTFFISDLFLAHKIRQNLIIQLMGIPRFNAMHIHPGILVFESMSLHSFAVTDEEIY